MKLDDFLGLAIWIGGIMLGSSFIYKFENNALELLGLMIVICSYEYGKLRLSLLNHRR